jgi:hypothetical protein
MTSGILAFLHTLFDQLDDFTKRAMPPWGRQDDPSSSPCLWMRIPNHNSTPDSL